MSKIPISLVIWILAHYLSPFLFFILSRWSVTKINKTTIIKNYFTYFITFQSFHILWARLFFGFGDIKFWEFDNLLFRGLPLLILFLFLLKKDALIWTYFAFSIGTIIFYILNIFEPGMSLKINMWVILEHLSILVLYFWYLRRNFREEFFNSFRSFKFWLLSDFQKRDAWYTYGPILAFFTVYGLVILVLMFKFRHVILGRIGFD